MGRVISIDQVYVPSRRSKPFLIGLYHGKGKSDRRAFFSDLCKELRFLHPDTEFDSDKYHRSLTVRIRAIIGDAIERAWIRGCKQCTGYYSCERCHIKGEKCESCVSTGEKDEDGDIVYKTVKKGAVKFISQNNPPRKDECWEDYKKPEPGEPDVEGMCHRNGISPLTEIPGFNPVTGFPLEEMHLVDGGAVKDTLEVLLNLKPDADRRWFEEQKKKKIRALSHPSAAKKRKTRQTPRSLGLVRQEKWNHHIKRLRKVCTPFEFPRKCRTLRDFKFWKMSETRQFMMYYMVPLMFIDPHFDNIKRTLALKFLRAYSLITGNILEPPSDKDLKTSRDFFKDFFTGMCNLDPKWCT
jgi:hypothetical protein